MLLQTNYHKSQINLSTKSSKAKKLPYGKLHKKRRRIQQAKKIKKEEKKGKKSTRTSLKWTLFVCQRRPHNPLFDSATNYVSSCKRLNNKNIITLDCDTQCLFTHLFIPLSFYRFHIISHLITSNSAYTCYMPCHFTHYAGWLADMHTCNHFQSIYMCSLRKVKLESNVLQ